MYWPPSSLKSNISPLSSCWNFSSSSFVLSLPRSRIASRSSSLTSPSALKIAEAPNVTASSISSFDGPWGFFSWFNRPCCTTIASNLSFFLARSTIFSSIVSAVTSRYTWTGFVWPMRWHRSMACKSACGFQSESNKIQVSAVCKLIPNPPALVDSKKTNLDELGLLYSSMNSSRSS